MVCRNCSGTKKIWQYKDLCGFEAIQQKHLRDTHPISRVDDTLARLTGATCSSKLGANSGFWQIALAEELCLLTTFITPFGRYCFHKLPFENTSAPEVFQMRMSHILDGLPGGQYFIDYILIYGTN